MLLYVNGDSFAAGTGLYDSDYIDNFEFYMGYGALSSHGPTGQQKFYDYLNHQAKCANMLNEASPNKDFYDTIKKYERERVWASTLGKNIGAEVINSAEPGSSMDAIIYRTILD